MVAVEQGQDAIAISEVRRFTRAQYEALAALGAFEGARVQLLRGLIVEMSPPDPPHADVVDVLAERLFAALIGRARVRIQQPILIGRDNAPEPDLAVVQRGDYRDAHPTTALLAIEVADSSLRRDRKLKAALYAEAAIAEYWIVNLVENQIEVHREPTPQGYSVMTIHRRGERVAMLAFPDVAIAVDDVLPPR